MWHLARYSSRIRSRPCVARHTVCSVSTSGATQSTMAYKARPPKAPSARPTHFIAIRTHAPHIVDTAKRVVAHVIRKSPELAKCAIRPTKLHISLLVATLQTDLEIRAAGDALRAAVASLRRTEPWLLGEAGKGFSFSVSGLGHFRQKVLYAAPVVGGESHWRLYRIRQELARQFAERGLAFDGDKNTSTAASTAGVLAARAEMNSFTPHMTLMKTSQAMGEMGWQRLKISEHLFQDMQDADFGAQHVNSIELLAMRSAEDASGYYQCEASVQLAAGSS